MPYRMRPVIGFSPEFGVGTIVGLEYLRKGGHCTPEGVTQGQILQVVIQYIDAQPARMHEDFRKLALEAMNAAWPCK
jgi:hypothetical protein